MILRILGLLLACGALLLTPVAASAHSDLLSSDPADGADIAEAPSTVTLVFNEQISSAGLQVVAKGPQGSLPLDAPTVAGATVTTPWPREAVDAGGYQVSYRVVSADGHPIDGSITFTIGGGGSGAEASSQATAGVPGTAALPSEGAAGATEPDGTAVTTSGSADDSDFPLWIPVVVVILGVGIGAGIAYWLRSRRPAS